MAVRPVSNHTVVWELDQTCAVPWAIGPHLNISFPRFQPTLFDHPTAYSIGGSIASVNRAKSRDAYGFEMSLICNLPNGLWTMGGMRPCYG